MSEATDDGTRAVSEPAPPCWCGGGRLRHVQMNGVAYLACDACGGELGDRPTI